MSYYIKLPIPVHAVRWFKNGDHPDDYSKTHYEPFADRAPITPEYRKAEGWEGDVVRYFRHPDYPGHTYCPCGKIYHEHGFIDTLEGGHRVCPGDWIITSIEGERWPVKPYIFEATYVPAPKQTETP